MRRAARVDNNQKQIIEALEAAGASVEILKRPLDLLIGYRRTWLLMEVKSSRYEAEKRDTKTRRGQRAFADRHPNGGPIATVWDIEGALRAIGVLGKLPSDKQD